MKIRIAKRLIISTSIGLAIMVLAIVSMTLDGDADAIGRIFPSLGLLGSYVALWSMPMFAHLIPQVVEYSEFFNEQLVFTAWMFNWLVYSALVYVVLQWRDKRRQLK